MMYHIQMEFGGLIGMWNSVFILAILLTGNNCIVKGSRHNLYIASFKVETQVVAQLLFGCKLHVITRSGSMLGIKDVDISKVSNSKIGPSLEFDADEDSRRIMFEHKNSIFSF